MKAPEKYPAPDKKLIGVCGLFCPACGVFIGTHEEPERLKKITARFKASPEDAKCYGCRSGQRFVFCKTCKMSECAKTKHIDFCHECGEYPCEHLKEFQKAMPHRLELWNFQARIKEAGYEEWFREMLHLYSCPECGTLNSAFDIKCRKCGRDPSTEYVNRHKDTIIKFMKENGF